MSVSVLLVLREQTVKMVLIHFVHLFFMTHNYEAHLTQLRDRNSSNISTFYRPCHLI